MIVIEVKEEDLEKVFEILSKNGRFTGLPNNRFRIDENTSEILEKIKQAEIDIKVIDEKK